MILFQSNDIRVRELEPADAPLLVKWLSDPTVLAYYEGRDRPHDLQLVKEHYYQDRDIISQCIVQYQSMDIGYMQFYEIDEEGIEKYGYQNCSGKIFGMDQFIGETDYWNKGIGTLLIQEAIKYITLQRGANKIIMDPQAWNTRALRVYEKNGFKKLKYLEKHEWHEGEYRDCWLMEYDVKNSSN